MDPVLPQQLDDDTSVGAVATLIGFDGEAWVIRVRAQSGFAPQAVEALEASARARNAAHPTAGIFFRLAGAFREAMGKEAPS